MIERVGAGGEWEKIAAEEAGPEDFEERRWQARAEQQRSNLKNYKKYHADQLAGMSALMDLREKLNEDEITLEEYKIQHRKLLNY